MKKNLLLIILVLFTFAAYSQKPKLEQRFYYKFSTKTLYSDDGFTKPVFAPLSYKAGRDINIEIKHFNPLQYEVSIEESSSNFFLADTAKWSSRIIIPSIPNAPKANELTTTTGQQTSVQDKLHKAFSQPEMFTLTTGELTRARVTSCDLIQEALEHLNNKKTALKNAMALYKNLVVAIEEVNNTYENLKALPELKTTDVSNALANLFIIPLNSFLTGNRSSAINGNPLLISSGTLNQKENDFYLPISAIAQDINDIKTVADKIENVPVCNEYTNLYKEFRNAYDAVMKAFTDFNTSRSEHLSTFKSTTALYDKLKAYAITEPEMVTSAITIEKDLHTITIKTKTGTAQPVVYDNIHIQPARGLKVDVATGFFFSNLSDQSFFKHSMDSIHSKKYLVNGVARDTLVQESYTAIYEKRNTHLSFGGMIFLQAHTQNPGNWNGGGYLGFGALFNDQARWSGSVGGSLLLGQKQRFNIHAGLILSQVDRLSPPYQTGTWYRETIDNIPTYRAWKAGVILGFSWNL